MANVKISELPAASAVSDANEFEINEAGTSKKVTGAQISAKVRSDATLSDVGVTATASELNTLDGITATTAELNVLDGITATTTELNYTDGVTSPIQTQLNGKAANTTQTQATWEAGTSTTESIVSPAKVKAAIDGQFNVSGSAPKYACRAWVNFNGTGTVSIRASGNVSSITDNGTGDYTVNFTTAMPDTDFSVLGISNGFSANAIVGGEIVSTTASGAMTKTTSSVRFETRRTDNNSLGDYGEINVAIFR